MSNEDLKRAARALCTWSLSTETEVGLDVEYTHVPIHMIEDLDRAIAQPEYAPDPVAEARGKNNPLWPLYGAMRDEMVEMREFARRAAGGWTTKKRAERIRRYSDAAESAQEGE